MSCKNLISRPVLIFLSSLPLGNAGTTRVIYTKDSVQEIVGDGAGGTLRTSEGKVIRN